MPPKKKQKKAKEPPLSEYELMRLERIRRNKAFLEAQGIGVIKRKLQEPKRQRQQQRQQQRLISATKRSRSSPRPAEIRRSSRQRGSPARYDASALSDLPQLGQPKSRGKRIRSATIAQV